MPRGKNPKSLANLKPAKPGDVRNPNGRKTAGASIREWINVFAEQDLTGPQLRKVARDGKLPWTKRAAAERILRTLEAGDLADFSGLLRGENNLEDLRGMGINTEVVKKFKQKTRAVPTGDGTSEQVIEREIELHDRAGADFDRILDRTEGRPKQSVEMNANVLLRTPDDRAAQAGAFADRLRQILRPGRN